MIIILRFLPVAVALLQIGVILEQAKYPLQYPWIALVGVAALPVASVAIAWRRVRFFDMLEKMTPSFVLMATLAFALLLAESRASLTVIAVIAAVSCFVSLELLFILAFNPARYPVNGLSRVNIAYVPIAVWYAAATSSGLLIFLHMDRIWHVMLMVALSVVLFRTTGHPGATRQQNAVWIGLGALVGGHVGLLGLLLPVSMATQGIVAAFLLSSALRARRYMYDPKPSVRQAWSEGLTAVAAFVGVLSTAKWL